MKAPNAAFDSGDGDLGREVQLAQALIRAPSPSGQERPAADVLLAAYRALGYDEAYLDEAGNAIGIFRRGEGPTLLFNGHIDTVPVGDEAAWPQPPLAGVVADGFLWGRGACDMKGPVAALTVAAADAVARGFRGTLIMSGVVQEEVGGLGARYLGASLRGSELEPDAVVLGEPSSLRLMLGHRGRAEFHLHFPGRIAHAARAELGENALLRAAQFLCRLEQLPLPAGGPLGGATATPTQLRTFPEDGANVVPGAATVTIDYRFLPDEDPAEIEERLAALAPEARVELLEQHARSERGAVAMVFPQVAPAYLAPGENPAVEIARRALAATLAAASRPFAEGVWWFATDAPHLAVGGAPVLGFGPGNEELAHTTREAVALDDLAVARRAYAELAVALSRKLPSKR